MERRIKKIRERRMTRRKRRGRREINWGERE